MELRHGNGISTGNVFAVNSVGRLGKVCDPYWNDISALVVCRQLGLGGGQAVNSSFFGDEAESRLCIKQYVRDMKIPFKSKIII